MLSCDNPNCCHSCDSASSGQAHWDLIMLELIHSLNNVLGTVCGNAELLSLLELDGEEKELSEQILKASYRGIDFVERMRNNAMPPEMKLERVDVAALVRDVIQRFETDKEWVRVESSPPTDAMVDPQYFTLALLEVLSNAHKAVSATDGAPVEVRIRQTGARLIVEISDSGVGLPASDGYRVFEPFFTGDNFGTGRGLGLSLARAIVRAHRGSLKIADREEGGVMATLTFPHMIEPS